MPTDTQRAPTRPESLGQCPADTRNGKHNFVRTRDGSRVVFACSHCGGGVEQRPFGFHYVPRDEMARRREEASHA